LPEQITVTNSSGIHGDKTEDFISMALLMLHNKMPQILANQTKQIWDMIHEFNIRGRTATVIGFGDVGRAAGLGAKRLGMKVIAVTRSGTAQPLADETISVSQLDSVLPRTDYLIVAAPLTADTRGLITDSRIASLPKGAGLINIGRSPIVDYAAVIKHLESKRLDGAILDVFDKEPLEPGSPLWTTPNLIVTPHISCDAPDYVQRVLDCWFANFAKLTTTGQLDNKVNRQLGY
jgi:phosphoglycerate dehydrogenase-like enzyme